MPIAFLRGGRAEEDRRRHGPKIVYNNHTYKYVYFLRYIKLDYVTTIIATISINRNLGYYFIILFAIILYDTIAILLIVIIMLDYCCYCYYEHS